MPSSIPSSNSSTQRQRALNVKTKVLRLRLKDKHAKFLLAQSREVNLVWNYSQDLALKVLQRTGTFMSAYDMATYTKGAGKEGLSLHSQTVQAVSEEYCIRRRQFKKNKLRWRVSHGSRRSLGWIPVKTAALRYKNGQIHYQGVPLSLWDSYGLAKYALRSGNFCEDARGRWYLNITVDVKTSLASAGKESVGIDLGLNDFAVCSNGLTIEAPRLYRVAEETLAIAQRANKKRRVRSIYAKIANRRNDFLHKKSTQLVQQYGAIFVGDVCSSGLAKTPMAKSVMDAGWSTFRTMLKYKCDHAAVWFDEVNERYSTQECCVCHARTGPSGLAGLAVRQWNCSNCKTTHDRDTNSAKVIQYRGELRMQISMVGQAKANAPAMNKTMALAPMVGVGYDPLAAGILGR